MEEDASKHLVDGDDGWISDESSFYGTTPVLAESVGPLSLKATPDRR